MEYKQNVKVMASDTDYTASLGLVGAVTFMQDNMCDYFKELGCDGVTMIPICQAFFVITKTKLKFHKFPKWTDEVCLKTSVSDVSKIRVNLNNLVCDSFGEICVEGIQELCPVDSETRKLRMVESTLFPKEISLKDRESDMNYSKFAFEKNDFDFVKKVKINLSNVDYYMHTNNVEYVKFCLSILDENIFTNKHIDTYEIHYVKESGIGDELGVYVRKNNDIIDYLLVNNEDIVIKAQLVLTDNK